MPKFFKKLNTNIVGWIRGWITKFQKSSKGKPKGNGFHQEEEEDHEPNHDHQSQLELLLPQSQSQEQPQPPPPQVLPRRRRLMNFRRKKGKSLIGLRLFGGAEDSQSEEVDAEAEEWRTLFFDENWTGDGDAEDDADEVHPLISEMSSPRMLPQFVKRVDATTDLTFRDGMEEESARRNWRDGGTQAAIMEVPLCEMDCSRRLLQVAGISSTDLILINDNANMYGEHEADKSRLHLQQLQQNRSHEKNGKEDSESYSEASVVSLLQKKYEKKAKHKLKYEAIQELSSRVKMRLGEKLKRRGSTSYSSLTSDGGDFRLTLPTRFYRKIGLPSKRSVNEGKNRMVYPWMKAIKEDPAMFVMKQGKRLNIKSKTSRKSLIRNMKNY